EPERDRLRLGLVARLRRRKEAQQRALVRREGAAPAAVQAEPATGVRRERFVESGEGGERLLHAGDAEGPEEAFGKRRRIPRTGPPVAQRPKGELLNRAKREDVVHMQMIIN